MNKTSSDLSKSIKNKNPYFVRDIIIAVVCLFAIVSITHFASYILKKDRAEFIKIGIIYVGDNCNVYTNNFIKAEEAIELEYQDSVQIIAKYNVSEGSEEKYIRELVDEGCNLIFATSYGYNKTMKRIAAEHPEIEFCMATGDNANVDPVLPNYHTYMGEIYQGRYISGVVAGMKMKELISYEAISADEAVVGYVAAFPYAEVISGYTAFILGVRSIVPEATMKVIYTNSWGEYDLEKRVADKLISEGCVIISQHSDTTGPASACEEAKTGHVVYHVGYNQSMFDVAPTSSLISSRIDWKYYMVQAVGAVLNGKKIEKSVKGNVHGNDIGGGLKEGWVQMLKLNKTIAAAGTQPVIDRLVDDFKNGKVEVFIGDYHGVDPFNPDDTIDLSGGYKENEKSSAPTFHYILDDVITVEEY